LLKSSLAFILHLNLQAFLIESEMRKLLLFILLSFSLATLAVGYQVQPMIVELSSQGKNSLTTYRLQNPSDATLPVEVEVFKRTFDENQQEVLVPAENDFIVLPPQVEVAAKGYQIFRAKYLGSPDLNQTASYRIVFKQLPLTNENEKSGVKMMFNFATLVFVSPAQVAAKQQSQLKCEQSETCTISISNAGDRVLDLSHFDYHFDQGKTVFSWTQFQGITSGRFIMPGHKVELNLSRILAGKTTQSAKLVNLFDPVDE
jgi:fimbrial chaperone protein